jgi:hypothetical protein
MRLLALVLAALLAACGDDTSPEQQIRALVQTAQDAANEQDADALQELVAESYADPRGLTKADIDRTLALQMLRGGRPYVLLRVQELELGDPASAQLRVLAGLARVPVGGFEEMLRLSADVYVFELELANADASAWRVTSARWRPASAADLSR